MARVEEQETRVKNSWWPSRTALEGVFPISLVAHPQFRADAPLAPELLHLLVRDTPGRIYLGAEQLENDIRQRPAGHYQMTMRPSRHTVHTVSSSLAATNRS